MQHTAVCEGVRDYGVPLHFPVEPCLCDKGIFRIIVFVISKTEISLPDALSPFQTEEWF
jgi:hypothetical protein